MATQIVFDTLALVTEGNVGTAPRIYSATTDQNLSVITTAGAIADQYSAGFFKVNDILLINYDVDGTPGQSFFRVTSTSGGSLVLSYLSDTAVKFATSAVWAGGGTTNAFAATGLTASSVVVASIVASTNNVSITSVQPGTNTLTVKFSADPGAATQVNYISIG